MSKYFKNKNIILIDIYGFLSTFLLFRACDTLYYLSKGISSSKYVFFTVISSVIALIMQIPISAIGDKINKKTMLLVSNLFSFLSIILFIISKQYIGFIIAIIFQTLQGLFSNGIVNSIFYEQVKSKKEFSKIIFTKSIFTYAGYGIAMILGGYVGNKSLVNMYYLSLIPVIINFIVLAFLNDIKPTNKKSVKYKTIVTDAIEIIKNNNTIKYLFLCHGLLITLLMIMAETHPEYSSKLGISTFIIGVYTALMLLAGITGEYIGAKIKKDVVKVFIIPLMAAVSLLLTGVLNSPYGIILIILMQLLFDIEYNGMISILHNNINDKSRVTVEGFLSVTTNLFGLIFGLIITFILKFVEVHTMYIISGTILFIYLIIIFIKYKESIEKNKN